MSEKLFDYCSMHYLSDLWCRLLAKGANHFTPAFFPRKMDQTVSCCVLVLASRKRGNRGHFSDNCKRLLSPLLFLPLLQWWVTAWNRLLKWHLRWKIRWCHSFSRKSFNLYQLMQIKNLLPVKVLIRQFRRLSSRCS